VPLVLWHFFGWQEGHPACKKPEWWVAGLVVCLEQGADLHMAQVLPLPLTGSCFSKIQLGFTFLLLAHPGSPGKRAVKRVCVCVLSSVQWESCNRLGQCEGDLPGVKQDWQTNKERPAAWINTRGATSWAMSGTVYLVTSKTKSGSQSWWRLQISDWSVDVNTKFVLVVLK